LPLFYSNKSKETIKLADTSAAVTHEALRSTDKAYDAKIHQLRPFPGQITTAKKYAGSY